MVAEQIVMKLWHLQKHEHDSPTCLYSYYTCLLFQTYLPQPLFSFSILPYPIAIFFKPFFEKRPGEN